MVTKLILENFTVFEKLEMDLSQGVNILIGKNGSGKTHILKTIYATQASIKENRDEINFLRKFSYTFLLNDPEYGLGELIRYQQLNGPDSISSEVTLGYKDDNFTGNIDVRIYRNMVETYKARLPQKVGNISYIPAKEMLANAPGFIALYEERYIHFEEIYKDILIKAYLAEIRNIPDLFLTIIKTIEKTIGGKVVIEGEKFFLEAPDGNKIVFTLVAEGMRKLALLLLLLKNGSIKKGSLLLWDEPEANMNPVLIRLIVEILLQLEQEGVQIILATHSYVLLKEFDLQQQKQNKIKYFSLFNPHYS